MRNNRVKILVIGTTDTQGGAARVGWDIGNELIRRGYDVKYIVGYKKSKAKYVYELHKPIFTKWIDENTRYNATSLFRHLRSYFFSNTIDFGASDEILNHPWYKEADIIHLHNLHGNFFKFDTLQKIDKQKKVVWTLHDMWAVTGKCAYIQDQSKWQDGYHRCNSLNAYPPTLWDNSKYMWSKKKSIYDNLSNTTVVAPSLWLDNIVSISILKHSQRLVIHNGVEQSVFTSNNQKNIRIKLGLPLDAKIITFVAQGGQTDPRKGWKYIECIISKFSHNRNIHFLAIGDGNSTVKNPNITTVPFVSNKQELAEYYSASDMLLFSSLAENCPLVVLEAMSCGLPVVSFDVGGVKELVLHKENGYISKYKDVEDLEKGINWVISLSSKHKERLSKTNRSRVEKYFTTKVMVDQYEKLFKQL